MLCLSYIQLALHSDNESIRASASEKIMKFIDGDFTVCQQYSEEEKPITVSGPKCPECGEPLSATGGCWSCTSCGYSRCG